PYDILIYSCWFVLRLASLYNLITHNSVQRQNSRLSSLLSEAYLNFCCSELIILLNKMESDHSKILNTSTLHESVKPKDEFNIDIDLHNGYPITQIDCSPNMKYVSTLSEFDKSVVLWSINYNLENTYKKSIMVDGIYFIASNFGERVLIISHMHDSLERIKMDLNVHRFHDEKLTYDYEFMDPYTLMNPVSADKLFRRLKAKINPPYIIKADCIIYVNDDEQLFFDILVNKYVMNEDKWINYLRDDLNDYNKISTPPGKDDIKNFIKKIASDLEKNITKRDCYIQGTETYGRHFKWTLNCKDVKFTLEVSQENSEVSKENKQEPVHEENERELVYEKNQQKVNLYVRQCQALSNDDLVMATEKCIILWTFIPSEGIRVHYIWGIDRDISDKEYWKEIFSKPLAERFLPQSDFDRIINEANIKSDEDKDESDTSDTEISQIRKKLDELTSFFNDFNKFREEITSKLDKLQQN
ncbi:13161_t:CDS:2, partial [Gigaspora margarita]